MLRGTLMSPEPATTHPTLVLVHGSGAADRKSFIFARALAEAGIPVFAYDKRGVGESTGDWQAASFEDLAGDVVAAFELLKSRADIDHAAVGMLGVSQAGWVMPLAALRAPDWAFLISLSGPGVPAAETTIDHAEREMAASGMPPPAVARVVGLMKLQYEFARTGRGWDAYAAARESLAARMGAPPGSFPGTADDPYFGMIRRLYFYDPAPTLRQLRVPTLALFGELDNNVLAEKNRKAWDAALAASGNRDYTLQVLPRANHLLLEADVGNNAEMATLKRIVPAYRETVETWLSKRVRGFDARD